MDYHVSDFFERPCRKNITAIYMMFNRERTGGTPDGIGRHRRLLTEVIVQTDGQTNRSHKHF